MINTIGKKAHMSRPVLLACFLMLGLLVVLINWQSSRFTTSLFENGQYTWLNIMSGSTDNQPLELYLGRVQETFWGPLSQLLAALLFGGLAMTFLKSATLLQYGAVLFCFLLLTKFEVLFFPPYGDAIGGPLIEAWWLTNNGFDYVQLYHEAGYAWGGPKVYMFSIYPTVQALLLKILPTQFFIIFNHLIVFAMASVIVAVFRSITDKFFGSGMAALLPVLLLFLPLFQSQTEAINMEMPCAFFIILSAYHLLNGRIHLAGVMSVCAILVKGTAVFASAGIVFIFLCCLFGRAEYRFDIRLIIWSVILSGISVFKIYSKFLIEDQHVSQGMVKMFAGWPSLYTMVIFYIFGVSLLVMVVFFFIKLKAAPGHEPPSLARSLNNWVMFVFAGAWFGLFINFYAVSPRYRVLVYPFILYCAYAAFTLLVKNERVRKWTVMAAIGIAALSDYGLFYKPMQENDHVLLERSLEYRADLKLNQLVVKRLEERYNKFTIGAPFVIAQMLAIPDFGYVTQDLDIMIYGFNCTYGDIKEFPGIKQLDIGRTIYVGVKVMKLDENLSYPIAPHDRVIEVLQYGNKKAWLFMGGVALDSVLRATRRMLLENVSEMLK